MPTTRDIARVRTSSRHPFSAGARTLVGIGCLMLWSLSARAQTEPAPEDGTPVKSSENARELYEQGVIFYNVGEYAKAIEAFRSAYLASPKPSLLFNIAQAYRKQGDCNKAAEFYQTYLREKPDAADRQDIEAKLQSARECARVQG